MRLAIGKDGKIGRQLPKTGEYAEVSSTPQGGRRGELYLSTHSIEADQAYYSKKENEARALQQAKRVQRTVQQNAQQIKEIRNAQKVAHRDMIGSYDPMREKLRAHFAKKAQMGETAQVIESLLPPAPSDFSQSGANPQYVSGLRMTGGEEWRADFRQHLVVGNPLTRDGAFGPGVTDYDRFVGGVDVNQTDVVENVVGGTMLGRLNDQQMGGARLVRGADGSIRVQKTRAMGFDWSWDGLTSALSDTAGQTVDNVVDSLPDQLAKQLQAALTGGGKATTTGNTITVQRPVTGTPKTLAQTIGLPPWALYSGLGLLGVGVTFMMIKAVKR